MSEELFRKKSLDKVKSPENLDDYIRVSNPGVWLLLISVIILLAGACVWGFFGHIDSTVDVVAEVKNGVLTTTVADTNIAEGMIICVADTECSVNAVDFDPYTGRLICTVTAECDIPEGIYDAKIVTERIKPLSFILN